MMIFYVKIFETKHRILAYNATSLAHSKMLILDLKTIDPELLIRDP